MNIDPQETNNTEPLLSLLHNALMLHTVISKTYGKLGTTDEQLMLYGVSQKLMQAINLISGMTPEEIEKVVEEMAEEFQAAVAADDTGKDEGTSH